MGKGKSLKTHNLAAQGEPFLWTMGGALVTGILMIAGFLVLVLINGITTFYPKPIYKVTTVDSRVVAGEPSRHEMFQTEDSALNSEDQSSAWRTLYKTGNFEFYHQDYVWIDDNRILEKSRPDDIFLIERVEWGPFIGFIRSFGLDGTIKKFDYKDTDRLYREHAAGLKRKKRIHNIERDEIGTINHEIEKKRLNLKKNILQHGKESQEYIQALKKYKSETENLRSAYEKFKKEADWIKKQDNQFFIVVADINGREKSVKFSDIVRLFPANSINLIDKYTIYFSRWFEFLTAAPREANTEGGVMPAIFGTFAMTILMVIVVAPFGIMAALYLREYAKQGRIVSIVRICVNNLAGVPSIVYGVFGLGFFAYIIGGTIDSFFFPERLPSPTFGTGGILWAALTLALLTVPVVIVATEEALAAVPMSLREGSLACGASKWQTIKKIVLPKAMPGIMTGLILAMARGAGEVAPLMLVGVVKLAPELPVDRFFPFIHLERSFMHLGFHIFDVGFQSRNSEAGKPMVFVTTLLLIALIFVMNAAAIYIRNRLKRKYYAGHF